MEKFSLSKASKMTGLKYTTFRLALLSEIKSNPDFKPTIRLVRKNKFYLLTAEQIQILCPAWEGVK